MLICVQCLSLRFCLYPSYGDPCVYMSVCYFLTFLKVNKSNLIFFHGAHKLEMHMLFLLAPVLAGNPSLLAHALTGACHAFLRFHLQKNNPKWKKNSRGPECLIFLWFYDVFFVLDFLINVLITLEMIFFSRGRFWDLRCCWFPWTLRQICPTIQKIKKASVKIKNPRLWVPWVFQLLVLGLLTGLMAYWKI